MTLVMPAMPSMGMPEMRSSFELPACRVMYTGKAGIYGRLMECLAWRRARTGR